MKYLSNYLKALGSVIILWPCTAVSSFAQEMHMTGMAGMAGMKQSKNVFVSIMDSMMIRMDKVPKGQSAPKTFISQMIPHHEAAIAMADYEIKHGENFEMLQLAKSIKAEQQSELTQMSLLLNQTSTNEKASKYFDNEMYKSMEMMMRNMPAEKSLKETDRAFAQVMLPHHQAAVDMARALLKYPENEQISAFARKLISDEQIEIEQMSTYLNK
jgi:uncharacterized protein (DUF305 family)